MLQKKNGVILIVPVLHQMIELLHGFASRHSIFLECSIWLFRHLPEKNSNTVLYTLSLLITIQKSITLTCTGSQAPQFLTTAVQAHAVFSSGYETFNLQDISKLYDAKLQVQCQHIKFLGSVVPLWEVQLICSGV